MYHFILCDAALYSKQYLLVVLRFYLLPLFVLSTPAAIKIHSVLMYRYPSSQITAVVVNARLRNGTYIYEVLRESDFTGIFYIRPGNYDCSLSPYRPIVYCTE